MDIRPLTVELPIGYKDKNGTHARVTFGKRVSGKVLFDIDSDPQAKLKTQYEDLLLRAAITEFGSLEMPVPLSVLLALDSIDRDDLNEAFTRFSTESLGDLKVEHLDGNRVKLALGYERNGLVYDIVEFGTRLTGMDEVAADKESLSGIRRNCFLAGRQVTKLAQSKGESVLEGPVFLEQFEQLPFVDLEREAERSGLVRAVLLLAKFTGWSEDVILSLPASKLNAYIREHNKIIAEQNGESSF
jgi:hypothetical protein